MITFPCILWYGKFTAETLFFVLVKRIHNVTLTISFFSTYMLQVMCRISLNKYADLNIPEFCLTKLPLKIFPLPTLKDEFVSEQATGFNNSLVNHPNYEFPTSVYNNIQ